MSTLVETSPPGEKNNYHTVYHQSYKKMKDINEKMVQETVRLC